MATRVVSLIGVFNDITGTPEANQNAQVSLLVPGGGIAINTTDNSFADATTKTVALDGSGTLAINVEPPGDLTPAGCRYQITTPSGNVIVSPVFAYSGSPINVNTWVIAPSYAGTLLMRAPVSDFTSAFEMGKIVTYSISGQATVVALSQLIDSSNQVQSVIDLNGDAGLYFYPNSSLDNPLRYYIAQLPDGSFYYFSCPAAPTGYQGAWNSGTAYLKHSDTLISPADVVLSGGILYQAVADNTNSLPPSVNWKVWPGERITWHKILGAPATGGLIADQTNIAADSAVLTGAFGSSTLQDELRQRFQADLRYAGPWSNVVAYLVNDVSDLSGTYYRCILAHTGHTPPNATYWSPVGGGGTGTVTSFSVAAPGVVTNPTTTPGLSYPTFGASGGSHSRGLVPDPGSSAGSARFLCENGGWGVPGGGGGGSAFSWVTKTTNYTVTTGDSGILVDTSGGNVTITLPTAVGLTQQFTIKKKSSDANTVTVATSGGQTIDGVSTFVIATQYQSIDVGGDGSNYFIA